MSDEKVKQLEENKNLLEQGLSAMERENQRIEKEAEDVKADFAEQAQKNKEATEALQDELTKTKKENNLDKLKLAVPELQKLAPEELEGLSGNSLEELTKSGEAYLATKKERDAEVLKAYGLDPAKVMKKVEDPSLAARNAPIEMKPASPDNAPEKPSDEIDAQIVVLKDWKNPEARARGGPVAYDVDAHLGLLLEKRKQLSEQA